jgi:CheY-like chemotaxis protein
VVDLLEAAGYKVEAAGSATEALKKLDEVADIGGAVIDIGLPDRSGDILVAEIRKLHPSLPIVIASGHDEGTLRALFADDDRIAFLTKPYRAEQLRAALTSLKVSAG